MLDGCLSVTDLSRTAVGWAIDSHCQLRGTQRPRQVTKGDCALQLQDLVKTLAARTTRGKWVLLLMALLARIPERIVATAPTATIVATTATTTTAAAAATTAMVEALEAVLAQVVLTPRVAVAVGVFVVVDVLTMVGAVRAVVRVLTVL